MRLDAGQPGHPLAEQRLGPVKFSDRLIELRLCLEKRSLRLHHPDASLDGRRQEMVARSHQSILAHGRGSTQG